MDTQYEYLRRQYFLATHMEHGYTKEMIKEILGSSWPEKGDRESGNQLRRRLGNEMRARGEKKVFPTAESRSKLPNFDENGKYIYPPDSGFNYMDYVNSHGGTENNKVS